MIVGPVVIMLARQERGQLFGNCGSLLPSMRIAPTSPPTRQITLYAPSSSELMPGKLNINRSGTAKCRVLTRTPPSDILTTRQ